ncbi:MAG: DUF4926 domain-containing protein [Phormidesmis sp.]
MELELYKEVALKIDVPDKGLRAGDVVTLVDFVPHPAGGEEGCILEVFDAVGESIAVVTVSRSNIQPLKSGEILSIRSLTQVG